MLAGIIAGSPTTRLLAAVLAMGTTMTNPEVARAEPGTDPVVFVSNWLQRGDQATEPRPDQAVDTVTMAAAPGEYEPATVSVRSARPHRQLRLVLGGDLTSDAGDKIVARAVSIRLADPFERWTKKKGLEQYLLSTDTVDLAADTTRRFWLTVHVPEHARPGTYRSKLVVGVPTMEPGPDLGRLQTLKVLTLEVRVRPIRLLDAHETGMAFFMFNDPAYHARLPDDAQKTITPAYQKRVYEDMRAHGMTTATLDLYPVVEGRFTFTESDPDHLPLATDAGLDDLVRRAKDVFDQARAMVTMDNYGRAYHLARAAGGDATAYARPRVEPQLPLGAYDALRQAAAVQIAAIGAELAEAGP